MNRIVGLLGVIAFLSQMSVRAQSLGDEFIHTDFDQDQKGAEGWLKSQRPGLIITSSSPDPLVRFVAMGKRSLEWIEVINAKRTPDRRLVLSDPNQAVGIPIERPLEYNRETAISAFEKFRRGAPAEFLAVVEGDSELPSSSNLSDRDFLNAARTLDWIYHTSVRWLGLEPDLDRLKERAFKDVRGYYFLSQTESLESKLRDWSTLTGKQREQLGQWLLGQCRNSKKSAAECETEWQSAQEGSQIEGFYSRYLDVARTVYDNFFNLVTVRKDLEWPVAGASTAYLSFLHPEREPVADFLRTNIEEEWRWGTWRLQMKFLDPGSVPEALRNTVPHVVFEPGALAHVPFVGASEIIMDANRSLEDPASAWTIRHEFGHVLGFPDCYIEFFDEARGVIVNYQLDTTNLMCSRAGKLRETHYLKLRRAYTGE